MADQVINDGELFLKYKNATDPKQKTIIKNKIALNNQKFVTYIINSFYNKTKEHKELREDLLQEGRIGLLKAIDGFDLTKGYQFSTYSAWWIKQAVNQFLLGQYPLIKVPGNIKTLQNKMLRKLQEENLQLIDLIEGKAKTFNLTEKMFASVNASIKSKRISSFDDPITTYTSGSFAANSQEITLKDLITNSDGDNKDDEIDYKSLIAAAQKALFALPERERLTIMYRYNVMQEEGEKKNE